MPGAAAKGGVSVFHASVDAVEVRTLRGLEQGATFVEISERCTNPAEAPALLAR